MDLRGQRFTLDLSDDDDDDDNESASLYPPNPPPLVPSALIRDVTERKTAAPVLPMLSSTTPTGFPVHRKRVGISAFKKQRGGRVAGLSASSRDPARGEHNFLRSSDKTTSVVENANSRVEGEEKNVDERSQIDQENKQRLASMTEEEIDEERRELLSTLDPSLIQRLLNRANLDDGRGDTGIEAHDVVAGSDLQSPHDEDASQPTVRTLPKLSQRSKEAESKDSRSIPEPTPLPAPTGKPIHLPKSVRFHSDDDSEPAHPIDLHRATTSPRAMHFPNPPPAPSLDPSSPSFLNDLHSKYYPSLPSLTSTTSLSWLSPVPTPSSPDDLLSPYHPSLSSLPPSALRFSFRASLLPPRIARAVPVSKGLHHHGDAPEAAGYTVPELARLARSTFPSQRCLAFQTLGRLLYRLGRGEWGEGKVGGVMGERKSDGEDGTSGMEVEMGLWRCVEEGRVLETLEQAATQEGGHLGSKAYATEALWLWQMGGGRRWKAG